MPKTKQKDQTLSDLISNPIIMGIGAIAVIPDILPVLIGGFIGYIISKSKSANVKKQNEHQGSTQ